MSDSIFKAPRSKRTMKMEDSQIPRKRGRTSEDFYTFCTLILEYENYETVKEEELRHKTISPLDSTGSSTTESIKSDSPTSASTSPSLEDRKDVESDEDSYDLVTCFCMKPFAGRPMIECSECLTWIHLSCAKIRKANIPEEYICQRCKDAKLASRRSQRRDHESLPQALVH
ncbi:hypothetical protein CHUAL_006380 [Chamberlinius hualienensis]